MTTKPYPLLHCIDNPAQLRELSLEQLEQLAEELRSFLFQSVSDTGGHLSAGLGTVELTIALHYVFTTPDDKLVCWRGQAVLPTPQEKKKRTQRRFAGLPLYLWIAMVFFVVMLIASQCFVSELTRMGG